MIGVNCVGEGGNGVSYSGDSLAFDAKGELLCDLEHDAQIRRVTLGGESLLTVASASPSDLDADHFSLQVD